MRDLVMKNIVVMFPYPSGEGLHIGHAYNYTIIDSYCRWLRFRGESVNQPFGYDAFGLPAENYARSIGEDPAVVTDRNIANFRCQMNYLNTQYEEKLVTCDKSYIECTQWLFTKLLEHDLAYKSYGDVNWCDSCNTVLANEQVKNGYCERCDTKIIIKQLNQWYFRITKYRDRLLDGLYNLDYPVGTVKQQQEWLINLKDWCVSRQRKWGCPIPIDGETDTLDTFVDSSFYYLRYLTESSDEFLPSGQYQPIDLYVGGAEHACMHLIYARFIHYFLYDIGIVPQEEPFNKVLHQGMITYLGNKMSKSKGNVINPMNYNADELRMFLMFLGPYTHGGDWNDNGLIGICRFINRIKRWLSTSNDNSNELDNPLQQLITKIDANWNSWKVNNIISDLMKFYNNYHHMTLSTRNRDTLTNVMKTIAPLEF